MKKISGWQLLETPVVLGVSIGGYLWAGIWAGLIVFAVSTLICHFAFGRK